eukprot:14771083-Alexandrium_andersonii.AAC.1
MHRAVSLGDCLACKGLQCCICAPRLGAKPTPEQTPVMTTGCEDGLCGGANGPHTAKTVAE